MFYWKASILAVTCRRRNFLSLTFIHLVVCLRTGPKSLPKRALHIVRSRASSFRCEYPLLSLRSSSSFLRLLPRLSVSYIPPFIFPSITCRRRQFLHNMCPIQLAFRLLISCRLFFCSLTCPELTADIGFSEFSFPLRDILGSMAVGLPSTSLTENENSLKFISAVSSGLFVV
jgi:hypothetical protein